MRAALVTDLDGLADLEPAWWDLFARAPAATPFSSPAWLLPWWHVFAPGALRTVAVWQGDRLAALAPLFLEDGAWGRRLLPLGIGISDHTDVLVDPAQAADAWPALFAALADLRDPWEVWSAEELAQEAAVLAAPVPTGWSRAVAPQSACPVLALPRTGEDVGSVVPAGHLRKWRMAGHRLARRRGSFQQAGVDSVPAVISDLMRLHGARWQSQGESGVLADPVVRRFHAAAVPALLRAGLLDLCALHIDDVVAGVYYGFRRDLRRFAYLQGFDPAFAFESPGTLLVGHALEQASREGATHMHFLRGQEPYKYRWGAIDRPNSRCTFRWTP